LFGALRPWLWPRIAVLARNSGKAARILAAHLRSGQNEASTLTRSVSSTTAPTGGHN
jgi:hypothetical protein